VPKRRGKKPTVDPKSKEDLPGVGFEIHQEDAVSGGLWETASDESLSHSWTPSANR